VVTFTMVARPAVVQMCNDAATNAAPEGRTPFDVPLRVAGDATNAAVAYWCCWTMLPSVAQKIQTWMLNHGATQAEANPVPVGTARAVIRAQRIAIFQAPDWTPAAALTALGLDVLAQTDV
jgi:hypothetical protein